VKGSSVITILSKTKMKTDKQLKAEGWFTLELIANFILIKPQKGMKLIAKQQP